MSVRDKFVILSAAGAALTAAAFAQATGPQCVNGLDANGLPCGTAPETPGSKAKARAEADSKSELNAWWLGAASLGTSAPALSYNAQGLDPISACMLVSRSEQDDQFIAGPFAYTSGAKAKTEVVDDEEKRALCEANVQKQRDSEKNGQMAQMITTQIAVADDCPSKQLAEQNVTYAAQSFFGDKAANIETPKRSCDTPATTGNNIEDSTPPTNDKKPDNTLPPLNPTSTTSTCEFRDVNGNKYLGDLTTSGGCVIPEKDMTCDTKDVTGGVYVTPVNAPEEQACLSRSMLGLPELKR